MKKFWIALVVVTVAFMMAVPAMATNVTFSGTYRVRGHWVGDSDLSDQDSKTDLTYDSRRDNDKAWYDMRFRMSTVFEVSERLSIHTRFDALDKIWGVTDLPAAGSDDNIDIDRIWMSIKSDWGLWEIGRMNTGVWGTAWVDAAADNDRIKYTLPIGNFALVAILQKTIEGDVSYGYADGDQDEYQIAGVYSAENWSGGLLYSYSRRRNNTLDGHTPANTYPLFSADLHSFLPYFTGQFGPFGITTELQYTTGTANIASETWAGFGFDTDDFDVDIWAFMLEATYEMGPLTFQAGYAFMSGDDDVTDGDVDGFFLGAQDWEKSLILNGAGPQDINARTQANPFFPAATTNSQPNMVGLDDGTYGTLYTQGVGTASIFQTQLEAGFASPGAHQFYIGADYAATEALSFSFLYLYAFAADEFAGWDDDFGHEINLSLSYDIYENLTYSAAFAYLFTGDFYEGGNAIDDAANGLQVVGGVPVNGVGKSNAEDMWVVTQSLVLSF